MTPEFTTEILNRFEISWNETEQFYVKLINEHKGWVKLVPLLQFIRDKHSEGESKYFRLGTSIYHLIISRSVDNGLRPDQKYIKIVSENDKFRVVFSDGNTIYRDYTIDSLQDARLLNLLQTLKDTLVD